MHEVSGLARGGKGRGDLPGDVAAFAHAGHDHAAGYCVESIDGPAKDRPQIAGEFIPQGFQATKLAVDGTHSGSNVLSGDPRRSA